MRIVNPAPLPAFRQSLAKTLIQSCPAELKHELDNGREPASKEMDLGQVVHQLVLGGCKFEEVDADSYRTAAAREHRDDIRARGFTPLLSKELEPLRALAMHIKFEIEEKLGLAVSDMRCERTIEWLKPIGKGLLLRCEGTPDAEFKADVLDLKVGEEPNPDIWDVKLYNMCYDVQAAAYREATGAARHHIVAAQMGGAGLVSVLPVSESYLAIGQDRWDESCETFARCIDTDTWPAYAPRTITPPDWIMGRFLKGKVGR
jgi:hypothetical protein